MLREIARRSQKQQILEVNPEWKELQTYLQQAKRVIDLGCGANPHPRAIVGVDAFLQPLQRTFGYGPEIRAGDLRKRGVEFVQADLAALPFADKSFDFAYAHHVFEHLSDPKKACAEMCRIAHAGVIITPSPFAEIAFGRPYHLWLVLARGNTIVFIRKTQREDRPFGDHPVPRIGGGYKVTPQTNPFDILLNDGRWYHGREGMPRLSRLIQTYWYSHSPVMETIFLWKRCFSCIVIQEDGSIE